MQNVGQYVYEAELAVSRLVDNCSHTAELGNAMENCFWTFL